MNFCRVAAFAFGNAFKVLVERGRVRGASARPSSTRTSRGSAERSTCRSNDAAEIVTEPNGEPPVGGVEDALDVEQLCATRLGNVNGTGDPSSRWWLFA